MSIATPGITRQPAGGGTLIGPMTLKGDPTFYITSTGSGWPAVKWNNAGGQPGAAGFFESQRGGLSRWSVEFGGSDPETGGNVGSSLIIHAFADNGSLVGTVLDLVRNDLSAKFYGPVAFNGAAPAAKPTVTGSRGGNAALASLLTALAAYGLITDGSTV
jgi:hypothetical protein